MPTYTCTSSSYLVPTWHICLNGSVLYHLKSIDINFKCLLLVYGRLLINVIIQSGANQLPVQDEVKDRRLVCWQDVGLAEKIDVVWQGWRRGCATICSTLWAISMEEIKAIKEDRRLRGLGHMVGGICRGRPWWENGRGVEMVGATERTCILCPTSLHSLSPYQKYM